MAFPTIPTNAAGRVLFLSDASTNTARSSPNLSSLTKNAGDLLIVGIAAYQTGTGTNAAFSGWSAGWTEIHDTASSTTMALGLAYKFSTGSETGTVAVTQAGTVTGHAQSFAISISGAHATAPPEAPNNMRASATGATPDTGPMSPTWGADDTLWVIWGAEGETSTTGSFGAISAAPANYTNLTVGPITGDVVGGVNSALAFRQLNTATEDPGTFTFDTSNTRAAVTMFAVRPVAAPPATPRWQARVPAYRGNRTNSIYY